VNINGGPLIVGYKFLDRRTTIYTIIAVAFNSLFLHLTENWRIDSHEPTINAVFAGLIVGGWHRSNRASRRDDGGNRYSGPDRQ
jgi:uncharacterized membrane-anchored protein YitT (DUF2179 family)